MDDTSRTALSSALTPARPRVDVASTTTPNGTSNQPRVATVNRQPTSAGGFSRARETVEANWSRPQTAVLLKIATALNQIGALDDLMVTIASAAAAATGTEFTSVYAYDESHTRTVASGTFGVPSYTPDLAAAASLSPTDVPAEAEVIRTGKTLYRTPDTPFPDPVQITNDWSDVIVPLIADGRVQGVLYARQDGVIRTFHREEIALLEGIGALAALAIVRARESEAARRRADHLELLNHLGRVLNADLDLHALCSTIYNETSRIVPSDAFFVALYDQGSDWIWFPFMVDRTEVAPPSWHRIGNGPTSQVIRTRQSLIVNQGDNPIYLRSRHFGATDHTVASALFVPLLSDNRLIGVLSVQRYDDFPYLTDDIRTIETIAHQSAAALARARLFERIAHDRDAAERHAADLRAVLTVSHAIASTANLDTMLDILATETRSLMPHDKLTLYRVSDDGNHLNALISRGADPPPGARLLKPDRDLDAIDRVLLTGAPEIIGPEQPNPSGASELLTDDPDRQPACEVLVPLIIGDQISGVMHLTRDSHHPFSAQEFTIVQILAEQAAVAIRNAELRSYNRNLYLAGIRALTSAVDAKDPYTLGHSERVSLLAGRLADALGQDAEMVETVALAGLMHDIGKIGIPDAILQKPGKLDSAEQAIMMRHAEIGAEILVNSGAQALLPLAELVRHHHEWFNGGGYPTSLAGHEIPIGARIIAVADAYDTMVTDRPYRKRRPVSEAIAELRRCAATQFDPHVIETFITRVIRRDRSTDELNRTSGYDFALPSPSTEVSSVTLAETGRIADARTHGLLVELADLTRHLTDLEPFLTRVVEVVRRRMDYDATYLLLVDRAHQHFELAAWNDTNELPEQTVFRQPLDVGICGHVYRTGKALNVVDVSKEPMFFNPDPNPAHGSELVVPLMVDRKVIGVLSVESPRVAAFTSTDVTTLSAVAEQVAIAIHVAQIHDHAKRAAATDPLTGLANHGAFYDRLGEIASSDEPFALVLFDVEGLKHVNDTAGHLAGDTLLREIAAAIREGVRDHDLVARYGGDEFGLILRGVNRRDATRIAARIRGNFLEQRGRTLPIPTTVRFGVATAPTDGNRAIDLVAVADARMYDMRNVTRVGSQNAP